MTRPSAEASDPARTTMTDLPLDVPALTVFFDGACPLCRREIALYQNLRPIHPGSTVCFANVADDSVALPSGTTRAQLLARFHVQDSDGVLLSGARAFVALWAALPGWRWLARMARVPGALWIMERAYLIFLRWRPMLQRR